MSLDTYDYCLRQVMLRCPMANYQLASTWTNWAFRKIGETRRWSWLIKQGQFLVNNVYSTGTVAANFNDSTVTGTGTAWTTGMIGRQFRVGTSYPIYTIAAVDDIAQTLTLDQPWGGDAVTLGTYLIYNAYFTVPTDFHSFVSLWDPAFNWQLWTNITQAELNMWDSQRASSGTAWVASFRDYNPLTAAGTPALPRYELWPPQLSQKVYPFLYESRPVDLTDAGSALPRYIRGDVLIEGALWQAALWPGPSKDQPNAYFSLQLGLTHQRNFERIVMELERQDDELSDDMIQYSTYTSMPFAAIPLGDSRWLQSHAL